LCDVSDSFSLQCQDRHIVAGPISQGVCQGHAFDIPSSQNCLNLHLDVALFPPPIQILPPTRSLSGFVFTLHCHRAKIDIKKRSIKQRGGSGSDTKNYCKSSSSLHKRVYKLCLRFVPLVFQLSPPLEVEDGAANGQEHGHGHAYHRSEAGGSHRVRPHAGAGSLKNQDEVI
jgi:hypothetical protein